MLVPIVVITLCFTFLSDLFFSWPGSDPCTPDHALCNLLMFAP